jgi:hypothetical protein
MSCSGREMERKTGVAHQPRLDGGCLVGRRVDDDVDVETVRRFLVDQVQEPLELSSPVASSEVGDDFARGQVQGGIEVGCPVPVVVVSAPLWRAGQEPAGVARCGSGLGSVFSGPRKTMAASGGSR